MRVDHQLRQTSFGLLQKIPAFPTKSLKQAKWGEWNLFLPSLGMCGLGWRRQGRHPGHQHLGGSGRADLVPKGLLHPWYLAFDSLVVTLAYGVPYLDNEFNLQKSHLSSPHLSPVHYK